MTIVGGEERVMRAREVLAGRYAGGLPTYGRSETLYPESVVLRAMLAFADEGSGIGELWEALAPYLQHRVDCRNRLRMGQRDCSCGLADILAASPDIDRSGLAQEVG